MYGDNILLTDLDWVVIEYNDSINEAVIDYKHGYKPEFDYGNSSPIRAQIRHCDNLRVPIPYFIVRYWPGSWLYKVIPMNETAIKRMDDYEMNVEDIISEVQYVSFLYRLRGLELPEDIKQSLKD